MTVDGVVDARSYAILEGTCSVAFEVLESQNYRNAEKSPDTIPILVFGTLHHHITALGPLGI